MEEKIYHEKQHLQFCAIHAINNLFQDGTMCSKEALDSESYILNPHRWSNPHKSMLGIGNYDVNVIMNFLGKKNYDVIWFDKRKSASCINFHNVFGFLLNSQYKFSVFGKEMNINYLKHWYSIRKLQQNLYFNLDSKLSKPVNIGNEHRLLEYLTEKLSDGKTEILLVVESGKKKDDVITNSENLKT